MKTIYDEVHECAHCETMTVEYIAKGYSDSGYYCLTCERKEPFEKDDD